ncbi:hypothetical protein GCM10018954_005830 [Kutzneria kofuensis]
MTASSDTALTLAASLHAAGLLPAACVSAFEQVRREQFIPDKMWVQPDDDGPYVPVDRVNEPGRWLGYVYSDRVIVTQFDDGHTVWPDVGPARPVRRRCRPPSPECWPRWTSDRGTRFWRSARARDSTPRCSQQWWDGPAR